MSAGPDEVIARFEWVVGVGRAIHEQDADLVADEDGLVEHVVARQAIPLNRHLHDVLARLIETAGEHERVDLIRVDGIDLHSVLLDRLAVQNQVHFQPLDRLMAGVLEDDLEGDASARVRDVADEFHVEHGDVGGLPLGVAAADEDEVGLGLISSHLALSAPCCRSKPDFCMSLKT